MWETQVRSLGQKDPLQKEMATHSSTLAWKIPWMEEPGRLQSMDRKEVDMTEHLHFTSMVKELPGQCRRHGFDSWVREIPWRRRWQPTPVLLPEKSHGLRSLVGCSPWSRWESDTTKRLHFHFSLSCIEKEMATHSRVLAWRIPGTADPSGLLSTGVAQSWTRLK